MRLLDGCCAAGVGADGYFEAGWDLIGLDNTPQPDYPYPFFLADVLDLKEYIHLVDALHVSPPCQLHTRAGRLRDAQGGTSRYEDLLTPVLEIVRTLDMPWIVENVPDARSLMEPEENESFVMLCGSMFGLKVQRHRWFLSNVPIRAPHKCHHERFELDPITQKPRPWGVYHVPSDSIPKGGRTCRDVQHAMECMGVTREVPWASLKEGIPPAYTEWIGHQLLNLTGM